MPLTQQLNVFHWHMTDTNSFPFELKNPDISMINQYGAYNALSIYDQEWIATFIEYATKRGERELVEENENVLENIYLKLHEIFNESIRIISHTAQKS